MRPRRKPPVGIPGAKYPTRGVGPFRYDDPDDRPELVFGGRTTLHFDGDSMPYVLLPVIPAN